MKNLLIVTVLAETPVGLMLLFSPTLVPRLLLGASLDAPVAMILSRIAGAALLSLSLACWLARDDGRRGAARALIAGLLLYNVAAVAVLAHAGTVLGLAGVLLWPAVALHVALAVWCAMAARSRTTS